MHAIHLHWTQRLQVSTAKWVHLACSETRQHLEFSDQCKNLNTSDLSEYHLIPSPGEAWKAQSQLKHFMHFFWGFRAREETKGMEKKIGPGQPISFRHPFQGSQVEMVAGSSSSHRCAGALQGTVSNGQSYFEPWAIKSWSGLRVTVNHKCWSDAEKTQALAQGCGFDSQIHKLKQLDLICLKSQLTWPSLLVQNSSRMK